MTVKSVNTRNLTKAELDKEDARIKEMTAAELRNFRESLDVYKRQDKRVMEMLMRLAGGIAVCGSDETVRAVRESAPVNVKIIEWGHRPVSYTHLKTQE